MQAPWQREVMILFLLFFSLNIASVSHWIIFIFALTTLPPSRYKIPDNAR